MKIQQITENNHQNSAFYSEEYKRAISVAKSQGGKVYHRANYGQTGEWVVKVNGKEIWSIDCAN